ncbi:quorum-sensing autoinducer synthase [Vibrio cincinnatiensis]|jgi:CAI-1 autoinducer synthase|uniref:alpha-hydroxyketone-type quorum-sensing autoinducer synthase n=1 Tax=Vibrio cincinnatiensis TaxID=675 RepID=UPI0012AC8F8E|nr:alpha-hydroxyketone-type quorum-sensing autoinducer synthase [Vibrio cincinnatiensis]MCG3726221.1 quorum-sensing autoinducer synthase [Vibrio cincinnatiensis]MCG3747599.1 quorum-sensing autoinducer synthase [Vibrio cincinnatiensis]MCG3767558.1 quorum-sensing autoinducer synthase [Vibrio cincinnatiensis]
MKYDAKHTRLPEFIQTRLNLFIHDLIESNQNGKHLVLGKRPAENDIILQSNDYLSLSNHPVIKARLKKAIDESQDSLFMSGIFLQDTHTKPPLEQQLADFAQFDTCLLSQSGWNANTALLQTICSPETPVYIDFFAHMSMWEGARYANAQLHPFMHNNCHHLIKLIKRHGPGLIAVDSIYSTIGTMAPLTELVTIAKQHHCAILVDESHSLGVYGPHGSGLLCELGLSGQVDFMTVSLAKTFAYRAGAIWANNNVDKCIPFVGYPAIFSSTILPYEVEALSATLAVIQESDDKRDQLARHAKTLRSALVKLGFTIRSQSQIIALETGDERNTEKVRDYLEEHGVFGAVFCRPATAKNKNIIRLSLNSSLTQEEIDKIIHVCGLAINNPNLYFK